MEDPDDNVLVSETLDMLEDSDLMFEEDETDALTLTDLLGFLDEVDVPNALRKRTKIWGEKIKHHRQRIETRLKGAHEHLKNIKNGLQRRGKAMRKVIRDASNRTARRIITGDSNKKVREYIKEPPVAKLIDCVSFTLGVILLVSAEFVSLTAPQHFWIFYITTAWAMIFTRIALWWGGNFKYFLFDFCYFGNLVFTLVLLLAPTNTAFLQVCFVWANGPIGLAMITWRNSLVFHSLEKVTSFYIHGAPPLAMMLIRWFVKDTPMCDQGGCVLSWFNWWVLSISGYLFWQVLQLVLTEIIGKTEIQTKGLQTSCRWIATHPKMPVHSISLKISRYFGIMGKEEKYDHTTWKTKVIFISFQAVYTMLTLLPCKILFESFWANMVYLFVLYIYCVWNGARYYIHVFAERYTLQFRGVDSKSQSQAEPAETKEMMLKNGELKLPHDDKKPKAHSATSSDNPLPSGRPNGTSQSDAETTSDAQKKVQ
uniref:Glycerophosphocholine acyltransferase 1 n=1 Tax=Lotharella globosa TaxID=91324 RepID=A0A6U2ZWK0_9EUKA